MKNVINFLQEKEKHNFHLVDNSQLPIIVAFTVFQVVLSLVFYWHPAFASVIKQVDNFGFEFGWIIFTTVLFAWFFTVINESGQGYHTLIVRNGLRLGMALFIVSEIMFFFAFFWGFFHVSLSPSVAIGAVWPPKGIQALDVWGLPLINTILLLSSGVTLTFAHHAILKGDNFTVSNELNKYLLITVVLGIIFLICQLIEYRYGISFSWKENIYGSTFFVTTGFHGFHVTIGTIFLLFCWVRVFITSLPLSLFKDKNLNFFFNSWSNFSFRKEQHLGFESAAWYWHFVDVVWIFLFLTVYWWGS